MTGYRIRWADDAGDHQVSAVVDQRAAAITFEVSGGAVVTLDEVTARAVHVLLNTAVYGDLGAAGPYLRLESQDRAGRWGTYGSTVSR